MVNNYKLTSQEAFEKVKAERASKNLGDISIQKVLDGASKTHVSKHKRYYQLRASSYNGDKVIRR